MRKFLVVLVMLTCVLPVVGQKNIRLSKSGIGLRFNSFGVPNALLDAFLYEHPTISGNSLAFEIRSYGDKGRKSVFSGLYSLEYSNMSGKGFWRENREDVRKDGEGEVTQINLTATVILNIFPRFAVHPYIGAGIGIGKISVWSEGVHTDELGTEVRENYKKDMIVPVGHLPVGIVANISDRFEIRVEGGFKNGFYFGGGAVYKF